MSILDSPSLPSGVEREGAVAGSAAGRAGSDDLPGALRPVQCAGVARQDSITRAAAEQRMLEKLTRSSTKDIAPLLPAGVRFNEDNAVAAFECVWTELVVRLRGDRWKLTDKVIAELRGKGYPKLLVGHDQR
jgi:hypothetical protein